jgi:hypothetical protein
MAAAPDNERGFWESTVVAALNDDVLAAAGSDWRDWRPFAMERIDGAELIALRSRARSVLLEEFSASPIPIVKDPRMCRLMRFWGPVIQDLGWLPRVVLPVRSPLEVAWSLRRRDHLGVGMACLVWLRHTLDAELASRGLKRAVLDWSRLLEEGPTVLGPIVERLDLGWAHRDLDLADLGDFLSPKLRRFAATPVDFHNDQAVTNLVHDVYAAILDLGNDPDSAAKQDRLDVLRARFDVACVTFEPVMAEQSETIRTLKESARTQDETARALQAELDRVRLAHAEADRDARERHEALATETVRLSRAEADVDRRTRERDEALARANAAIARYADTARARSTWRRFLAQPRRLPAGVTRKDVEILRSSPLFDEAHYLAANPDVRAAGGDAALHFLIWGWKEGRDPGPLFSTTGYLGRYPDVAASGVNPLLHYLTGGQAEGRDAVG